MLAVRDGIVAVAVVAVPESVVVLVASVLDGKTAGQVQPALLRMSYYHCWKIGQETS